MKVCKHPKSAQHHTGEAMQWCMSCGALRYEHGWSDERDKSIGKWLKPTRTKRAGKAGAR